MYDYYIMFTGCTTTCTTKQQGVLQLSLLDDTVHQNNVPTNAKNAVSVKVFLMLAGLMAICRSYPYCDWSSCMFFNCNGSHSWHLTDKYGTILMCNHIYKGHCNFLHQTMPCIILSPPVKHDAIGEKDGQPMPVSTCNNPGWTITKGTLWGSGHSAELMWYGVLSHPATLLGMGPCD